MKSGIYPEMTEKVKIYRAKSGHTEGFAIKRGSDLQWQRKDLMDAADDPLSPSEELIIALCEHIVSLEKEKI